MTVRRWAANDRGAVTILVAVAMVAAIGCLAFAVDLGSIYLDGRRLQGTADAAALAAVNTLATPTATATQVVADNGWAASATAQVVTGTYDPTTPTVAARFHANAPSPNAVQVSLSSPSPLFFGRLFGRSSFVLRRRATGARTDLAAFSLGSRLASMDGGVANALLSALTGSSVSLSVADYQALASADIDIFAFSSALQTQLSTQAMSFNQTLATNTSVGQGLSALSSTLNTQGSAAAAAAINRLLPLTAGMPSSPLNTLVSLGPIGSQDHAAPNTIVKANAWDLLVEMLEISGGARQIKLSLGSTIPGLLNTTIYLAIGDRSATSPWMTVTAAGDTIIQTSQTRVWLDVSILSPNVLQTGYSLASIRVPLYIELAAAQAKLSSLTCSPGANSVTLLVQPSIGHASIADVTTTAVAFANQRVALSESPAAVASLPLLSITASARVNLSDNSWQTVAFSQADIAAGTTKTVSSSGVVTGIATSLLSSASISVAVGPLRLPNLGLGATVGTTLQAAAPALDTLLGSLLGMVGVHLGQADVRIDGLRCGVASLVA